MLSAEEVARSLGAAWSLLERDAAGLRRFDATPAGLRRSFATLLLAAPLFVVALAAERVRLGLLQPHRSLFDDPGLTARVAAMLLAFWLVPPLLASVAAGRRSDRRRLGTFTVASNWSSVLVLLFMALPAFLLARGLATPGLALVVLLAFAAVAAHLRWFVARAALQTAAGLAALLAAGDLLAQGALARLLGLV